MQYKISIIHPSRNRPQLASATISNWLGNAKNPDNIEYILSVDKDDKDFNLYKSLANVNGVKLYVALNKSAIEAINRATKKSLGNVIVVVSDDFLSFPNWDEKLLKELEGKEDFIVKTKDGIQPTLITLPIMDRAYYERFGYIYMPEYQHMHCDEEMTCVGHMLGKVINSDLLFEHIHYSTGKFEKDAISARNDATWSHGKKTINSRKKINFGLKDEEIVKPFDQIKWH